MSLPLNIWKSPVLQKRFLEEAKMENPPGAKDFFWLLAPQIDSKREEEELTNFIENEYQLAPHPMQQVFAADLMRKAMKEIHHDGYWIVGWTNPPPMSQAVRIDGDNVWSRLVMIFMDEDGDPQFTMESMLPVVDILGSGLDYYVARAEQSWQTWNDDYGKKAMKEDFGVDTTNAHKEALASLRKGV